MGSNALRPAARLRQSYHLPTCRKRGSHPKTKSTSNFGEASTPAGKVAVVGAGILIATSKVVVAGQSSGGDTTAVFGTGLVDALPAGILCGPAASPIGYVWVCG